MNQFATAIRKLNQGENDLEQCDLTSLELTIVNSIGSLMEMSSADLANYLQGEDDPTEWLIPFPIKVTP